MFWEKKSKVTDIKKNNSYFSKKKLKTANSYLATLWIMFHYIIYLKTIH